MSIAVEGNQTRQVIASLLGEPGVATLHDTNGRWDLLAELRARNLSDLSKVLEHIRLIKGISNTESSIHLETYRRIGYSNALFPPGTPPAELSDAHPCGSWARP